MRGNQTDKDMEHGISTGVTQGVYRAFMKIASKLPNDTNHK